MKKVFRFFYVSALLMAVLTVFMPFNKAGKTVCAAVPEGQTLDTVVDTISFSDLTMNGMTGQTMLNTYKNTTATYTKTSDNGSLVFKFKYDVVDVTKTENIEFRIKFDVNSGSPNSDNALWLRGDGNYLKIWSGSALSWNKTSSLTLGTHEIEYGRVALYDGETPTGSYYVYFKDNGVEKDSSIIEYDKTKMSNVIIIETNFKNSNVAYDANLSYEDPQYLSVSDLQYSNTLVPGKAYKYDLTNAPTNKSVVFVADWVNKTNDYANFYIGGEGSFMLGDKDTQYNWYTGGAISPRQNKVCIYKTNDETGLTEGDAKEYAYPTAFEIGSDKVYRIEYGRLAIMDGDTFTGRYHIYYKVNGQIIGTVDNKLLDKVAAGGYFRIGGFDNDLVDAYTYENPKEIGVSDLKYKGVAAESQVLDAQKEYFYDNTDHTDHYSIDFKAQYEVNASEEHQFHFSNENWGDPCKIIIKGSSLHLGKAPSGNVDITKTLTSGKHNIEFSRRAIFLDGVFIGKYKVTFVIDGEVIASLNQVLPDALVQSNKCFITGSAGKVNKIYETNPTTYETADVISFSDLKKANGDPAGDVYNVTSNTEFSYTATAEHKSVIFNFKYQANFLENTDDNYPQIHFNNTYITSTEGAVPWIRSGAVLITKNESAVSYQIGSKPFTAKGQYEMEVGKLYITGGKNAGKYYIYVKSGDTIVCEYISAVMPDVAKIFITGSNGDVMYDIDYVEATYETADVISFSDLKKANGDPAGDVYNVTSNTEFSYTATAEHKSVIFNFKYQANFLENTDDNYPQIHFNNTYITSTEGAVPWIRSGAVLITKNESAVSYQIGSKPFTAKGQYEMEVGKLYITGGSDAGKYYIYVKSGDTIVCEYISAVMPDVAKIFITGSNGDVMYDIDYVEPQAETPDVISVSDLKSIDSIYGEALIGSEYIMTRDTTFGYDATAEHKSVIFKFLYDVTNTDPACQFHFNDTWLSTAGGTIWFQKDGTFIQKKADSAEYIKVAKISGSTLHNVELGKIYITGGADAGKYRIYAKVDGEVIIEYVIDSMPDKARLFLTGSNGDAIYDVDYMPVELDSNLYTYWTESSSGVQFVAEFGKRFKNVMNFSEVGFIITPAGGSPIKLQGRLVESGNNYVVKAAVANMDEAHITKEFTAEFYYVLTSGEQHSCKVSSSLFAELKAQPSLSEGLQAVKNKVLEVVIDEDTMEATGAVKSGDASSIVLTGAEPSYFEYVVNGEVLVNNSLIMIGYTTYKATVEANVITLTKQAKDMVYGGSEHFYETNKGHDENMTAQNLSVMTSNLGLTTVRMDIYLSNLFEVNEASDGSDELVLNNSYRAQVQSVIDELKANGGVVDFLAVLWTVQPTGFKTWEGKPWATNTAPNPSTQADMYLKWLQLNGEAARRCAQLFPDVNYFETWNEAELSEVLVQPIAGEPYTSYSTAEKALILTDLMYYFNEGIKAANPKNILTTNSLCCSQQTNDRFAVTSQGFLRALYEEITDNDPVTGKSLDKDPNNYFQVINIHPYIGLGTTASNWKAFVKGFNDIAVEFGDGGTQVWITEFGYNNVASKQSDLLDILGKANEIDCLTRFYFYKVHDYTDKIDKDRWGLYNNDCTIKAVGTAVKDFIAE